MTTFGDLVSGAGNYIDNNKEKFAIMADMVGTNLDPNNAFAGVGKMMGQSSLANKALQEEKQERQDWRNVIASMVSGKLPTTAPGEPGLSSATIKPAKDGSGNELTFSVTEPTDRGKVEAAQNKTLRVGDLMSYPF